MTELCDVLGYLSNVVLGEEQLLQGVHPVAGCTTWEVCQLVIRGV